MSDTTKTLERERDYWKRVASYLAGCHAATLDYDGNLSSTSKSRKERFVKIVKLADEMLAGNDGNAGIGYARSTTEQARQYCFDALRRAGEP